MLEKLAKQTAIYGISTIVLRMLSYLLTILYTRVFGQEAYGIVTDVYALIPFALVLLSMGMESSYFRFSAKAEEAGGSEAEIKERKRKLFATTWGATLVAAALFFGVVVLCCKDITHLMGEAYRGHEEYILMVGAIIFFDVAAMVPFSRLREQGRALKFVALKACNVVINVGLNLALLAAGLFEGEFGVGLCHQPCGECGYADDDTALYRAHRATHRPPSVADNTRLLAAAAHRRHCRHGQRVHRPSDD